MTQREQLEATFDALGIKHHTAVNSEVNPPRYEVRVNGQARGDGYVEFVFDSDGFYLEGYVYEREQRGC